MSLPLLPFIHPPVLLGLIASIPKMTGRNVCWISNEGTLIGRCVGTCFHVYLTPLTKAVL